jgi:hypothetical protein
MSSTPAPIELVVEALPVRAPRGGARLLLEIHMYTGGTAVLVAQEAAGGQFVRVRPLTEAGVDAVLVAMSPDGRALLVREGRASRDRVGLCDLSSGRSRWFAVPYMETDWITGAIAPDGATVAEFHSSIEDYGEPETALVSVTLLDVDTGDRTPIWQATGSMAEHALAWSPDGELLAICYVGTDEATCTAVVTWYGAPVSTHPHYSMRPGANDTWTQAGDSFTAVPEGEGFGYVRINPRSGHVAPVPGAEQPFLASIIGQVQDRLILRAQNLTGDTDPLELLSILETGGDISRPWLMIRGGTTRSVYTSRTPASG